MDGWMDEETDRQWLHYVELDRMECKTIIKWKGFRRKC
jgi:hypothetical protein